MNPKPDNATQRGHELSTRPGGSRTEAAGFRLPQLPRHLARRASAAISRNRRQELLTEKPSNLMLTRN